MYYLKSRYYDPFVCRFINADVFASTGQGFIGMNMFAYCLNNPICKSDHTGYGSRAKFGAALKLAKVKSVPKITKPTASNQFKNKGFTMGDAVRPNKGLSQSALIHTENSITLKIDDDLDMALFTGTMIAKIAADSFWGYMATATLIGAVASAPVTAGTSLIVAGGVLSVLTETGISIVTDTITMIDGISKFNQNGGFYVEVYIPSTFGEIFEFLMSGPIRVFG